SVKLGKRRAGLTYLALSPLYAVGYRERSATVSFPRANPNPRLAETTPLLAASLFGPFPRLFRATGPRPSPVGIHRGKFRVRTGIPVLSISPIALNRGTATSRREKRSNHFPSLETKGDTDGDGTHRGPPRLADLEARSRRGAALPGWLSVPGSRRGIGLERP